jgi:hypothetical protein
MDGWVAMDGFGAGFAVSMAAPLRRNETLIGRDGVVVMDSHFPGPERPGSFTIARPDGSRDEVEHPGANAYERMVTAFVAEADGDAKPRWTPAQSVRLATLYDRLHAGTRF